eukprot:1184863-Prorocentrum_minimum.AAC.2
MEECVAVGTSCSEELGGGAELKALCGMDVAQDGAARNPGGGCEGGLHEAGFLSWLSVFPGARAPFSVAEPLVVETWMWAWFAVKKATYSACFACSSPSAAPCFPQSSCSSRFSFTTRWSACRCAYGVGRGMCGINGVQRQF